MDITLELQTKILHIKQAQNQKIIIFNNSVPLDY
jgi:hypothetical protein